MDRCVWYEQPLNERMRVLLRLEFLYERVLHAAAGWSVWEARAALESLIELLGLLGRAEVRAELLKEADRLCLQLDRQRETAADPVAVDEAIRSLAASADAARRLDTLQLDDIRRNEFLNALRQRASIPGGACSFDLPALHHWLNRDPEIRADQLDGWLTPLLPGRDAAAAVLRTIRATAEADPQVAQSGFYQQALDPALPAQLVRVGVTVESGVFPEISGGRHRFTIRFLCQPNPVRRPFQTDEDTGFLLACCVV